MTTEARRPLRIGITCYPTVGGSGILASALGVELAARGHDVHFISYERPFRIPADATHVQFHPVVVNDYELFKYPDYTLPLSVKMAEVAAEHRLDVLHVHYAVPHATAAILARSMSPVGRQPKVVTTLHGTDTTLLARDPGYGPAIRHALAQSDAVSVVSNFLRQETERLLQPDHRIDVVHNFFEPRPARRGRDAVRDELGLKSGEALVVHASNLRALKRVDLVLAAAARVRADTAFKLLILAGGRFAAFEAQVRQLGLGDRVIVRENVVDIEDYLQAADLGLFSSESESFCLSILEAMCFECPCVATAVGGVPEVVTHGRTGLLHPVGDVDALARSVGEMLDDPARRIEMGRAAKRDAREKFSAAVIVPQYEAIYWQAVGGGV